MKKIYICIKIKAKKQKGKNIPQFFRFCCTDVLCITFVGCSLPLQCLLILSLLFSKSWWWCHRDSSMSNWDFSVFFLNKLSPMCLEIPLLLSRSRFWEFLLRSFSLPSVNCHFSFSQWTSNAEAFELFNPKYLLLII